MMRVYTCVFQKDGKVKAKDVTAPWDRGPAIKHVREELKLCPLADKLFALVPGQFSERAWLPEQHMDFSDYVPNGF